ncbi:MAG: hypothetical protein GF330_12570 [Candidatus Eisenbacteria bacterium]|nr:hypothetical protein [Candidatus Eisenbacteria bacterium]
MFEQNLGAVGGGLLLEESSPRFEQCVFRGNVADGGGGGLHGSDGSSPVFLECLFVDNHAQTGGAGYFAGDSAPEFLDCTFVRNSAAVRGGGLAAFDCDPLIRGCTFSECAGGSEGGAICFWLGTITIERSIIAFGTCGPSIFIGVDGHAQLSCCDIFGNVGGDWIEPFADQLGSNGNLSADPLFCPGAAETLYLREDSPCAPFTPPNADCDLIGAWPIGCLLAGSDEGFDPREALQIRPLGPNPACGAARLRFIVPARWENEWGTLRICDASGRTLRGLDQGPWPAGVHEVAWDGCDARGRRMPAGVYYCRLRLGAQHRTATILRIR